VAATAGGGGGAYLIDGGGGGERAGTGASGEWQRATPTRRMGKGMGRGEGLCLQSRGEGEAPPFARTKKAGRQAVAEQARSSRACGVAKGCGTELRLDPKLHRVRPCGSGPSQVVMGGLY
jgi:hypothetical protein